MKKYFLLLILLEASFIGHTQSHLYFNFVSHNEETGNWNSTLFYINNRTKLVALADSFQAGGVTWNMQSDWVYLSNVLSKETSIMMSSTNNKNILRWMYEDRGVEMDPHAHESSYFYPDVVKLMDSVGLPESKVIGGSVYNDSNGHNIWTNLVNGQYGNIFPSKFWKPDYMMGGGTPNHLADLKYYGLWNPQSPTTYLVNDTSVHLTHIGVGCTMKVYDTTDVAGIVSKLRSVAQNIQAGVYPINGFYIQTIFFEQADLNSTTFMNKLLQIADSANVIVNAGQAQWKTFKQAYTIWENNYQKQAFQLQCGQSASTLYANEMLNKRTLIISPNPASDMLNVTNCDPDHQVQILTLDGRIVHSYQTTSTSISLDISAYNAGIYLLINGDKIAKLVKD